MMASLAPSIKHWFQLCQNFKICSFLSKVESLAEIVCSRLSHQDSPSITMDVLSFIMDVL